MATIANLDQFRVWHSSNLERISSLRDEPIYLTETDSECELYVSMIAI